METLLSCDDYKLTLPILYADIIKTVIFILVDFLYIFLSLFPPFLALFILISVKTI